MYKVQVIAKKNNKTKTKKLKKKPTKKTRGGVLGQLYRYM